MSNEGRGKIIQFKPRENNEEVETTITEIKPFDSYKGELLEMIGQYNLVGRNEIEARMISEVILDNFPEVLYCRFSECISRKGRFIEVIPIYKEESTKQPLYVKQEIFTSYINKLMEEGILIEGPGGMLFWNPDKE